MHAGIGDILIVKVDTLELKEDNHIQTDVYSLYSCQLATYKYCLYNNRLHLCEHSV